MSQPANFVFERTLVCAFGPPGAGKGTLYKYGLKTHKHADSVGYFSVGDEMRKLIEKEDKRAMEMKEYVSQGKLVPDHLTRDIVSGVIQEHRGSDILVIDGLPRCFGQIRITKDLAAEYSYYRIIVVHIDTPTEVCIQRIIKREEGRIDDGSREKAIDRINTFEELTLPVLPYLRMQFEYMVFRGEHMQRDAAHYGQALVGMIHRMVQP